MRCYKITAQVVGQNQTRYAGTNATARQTKKDLMEEYNLPSKFVVIEPATIELKKDELLKFINNILKRRP